MLKIMLHGATMGTNFGDFLFAKLFYEKVKKLNKKGVTYFYESKFAMSDFFKEHLKYNYNYSRNSLKEADALIYISGGYFGERRKNFKESVLRFLRYALLGYKFMLMRKPIAIIGVGVGPLSNILLRYSCRKIFNYASLAIVRDIESREYLKKYGVKNNIIVTTDTAHVLSDMDFQEPNIQQCIEGDLISNKYIFLHINAGCNTNDEIIKKIIKPLNSFLQSHPEYGVIIGADQYNKLKQEIYTVKNYVNCNNIVLFHYNDPVCLCEIIRKVDLVITTKLHVGIIGAVYSKSVISISAHSEKISRYYKQINESYRSISLKDCTNEIMLDLLNRYHNVPIILDNKIFELAKLNFDLLSDFINDIKKN